MGFLPPENGYRADLTQVGRFAGLQFNFTHKFRINPCAVFHQRLQRFRV